MRWFKRKPVRRGGGKSPEQKAKEQQARVDEYIGKTFLKYLQAHPTVAEQLAISKFNIGGGEEGEGGNYSEPQDFRDKLQEVKDVVELGKDMFGEKGNSGITGLIKDIFQSDKEGAIAKSIAGFFSGMSQGFKGQHPQAERIESPAPQPKLEQPKPQTQEQKQLDVISYIEGLTTRSPKEAAEEIYRVKDNPEDMRSVVWVFATNNPFDELLDQMEGAIPPFLAETVGKIDRIWLSALYDELNALKKQESVGKNDSDEGEEVDDGR